MQRLWLELRQKTFGLSRRLTNAEKGETDVRAASKTRFDDERTLQGLSLQDEETSEKRRRHRHQRQVQYYYSDYLFLFSSEYSVIYPLREKDGPTSLACRR